MPRTTKAATSVRPGRHTVGPGLSTAYATVEVCRRSARRRGGVLEAAITP